jgi:hypothetical protein
LVGWVGQGKAALRVVVFSFLFVQVLFPSLFFVFHVVSLMGGGPSLGPSFSRFQLGHQTFVVK